MLFRSDGVVDKVYEFRDGSMNEYLGGIYYFLEKRRIQNLRDIEIKDKANTTSDEGDKSTQGKLSYQQKKEAEKVIRKIQNQIDRSEERIMTLEDEVKEWDIKLSSPEEHGINLSDGSAFAQYESIKKSLADEMHNWEQLNHELESIKE